MSFFSSKLSKDKEEKVVALVSSILDDFQKDFAGFYNVNVAQKPKPETTELRLPKVAAQVEHLKRGNLFKVNNIYVLIYLTYIIVCLFVKIIYV